VIDDQRASVLRIALYDSLWPANELIKLVAEKLKHILLSVDAQYWDHHSDDLVGILIVGVLVSQGMTTLRVVCPMNFQSVSTMLDEGSRS